MARLLFLLLLIPCLQAADFHVDQATASEIQDGSPAFPFKTIGQASQAMQPGDTCYIHRGTYRETLEPARSGAASAPIRYAAFDNESVVVSALEPVANWTLHSGAVYKASGVDMDLGNANAVYFNGSVQQLARWPNDLDGDPFTNDAYKVKTTAGTYSDSYISHDDIPDYWTSGVMFWLGAHSGCAVQRNITGFDPATRRLSFTPFPTYWPFGTHSPTRMEHGHRGTFYLMNRLEALDAPGEWFYDAPNTTLYFHAPGGIDPSDATVEIATRGRSLNLPHNYVELDRLNLIGAPLQINGSNCKLTNLRVRHCVEELITDLDSATAGGAAVLVYGNDLLIENCLIEEGTATGINIGMNAANTVVRNCAIRNFDKQGNHCSPIRSSGPGALITRNQISGSARDCARVSGAGSVFSYNEVSKGLLANADGGLFYVTGNSTPVNVTLHHNWFHTAHSPDYAGEKATGIYLDNNSAGFKVHHNVVWNVGWGALHFNWDALQNEIYNNTFWDVGYDKDEKREWAAILSWIPVQDGAQTDVRDNILINNLSDVRQWWDSGAGSMTEDETLDNVFRKNVQVAASPFVSLADKNFMLVSQAELVDQGEIVPGVTDGYLGAAPDIGAYESGGERWIPGADWTPTEFSWVNLVATFASWVGKYSLPSNQAGLEDDPDEDGLSNFHEYCVGGDPSDPRSRGAAPRIVLSGQRLDFIHPVREDSPDIEYRLEYSATLKPGEWIASLEPALSTADLGDGLSEATRPLPPGTDPRFVRLKMTRKQ